MNGKFILSNPGEMEATLTVTMKLKEWEALGKQLNTAWPSWEFARMVSSMTQQTTKQFYGQQDA